jgi:hypothetical protein
MTLLRTFLTWLRAWGLGHQPPAPSVEQGPLSELFCGDPAGHAPHDWVGDGDTSRWLARDPSFRCPGQPRMYPPTSRGPRGVAIYDDPVHDGPRATAEALHWWQTLPREQAVAKVAAREGLTTDRTDPRLRDIRPDGMQAAYLVLSDDERARGFIRPVRRKYLHITCGSVTTMGLAIAETYARDPKFYGGTYCAGCREHLPVGVDGEFIWDDGSGQKVGT